MNNMNRWVALLLRSPLLWGGLLSGLYYAAISAGIIDHPLLLRFTAGHVVEYFVVIAFLVGGAALGVKAVELFMQRTLPEQPFLDVIPVGGQPAGDAAALLAKLDEAPAAMRGSYLIGRLRAALEHVVRLGHADALNEEIKYLSDMDAIRAQQGYAFVRVIIWAIPILGLLGTVIGITGVFANIDLKHFDASIPAVLSGLQVAFDTTGLALALSMTLMFGQYFVDRLESGVLTSVDGRINAELVGRFVGSAGNADPELAPVRRMIEGVVQATDRLVNRQAEIWRATIDAAEDRYRQLAAVGGKQLETALAAALGQSLKAHAATLVAAEQQLAEQNHRNWAGVQQALVQTAESAARQQGELAKQSEVLLRVVDATGHVAQLEQTLNRNLTALAGARNFDETLVALSAAVQLLSARLGLAPGEQRPAVNLARPQRTEQAA